MPRIALITADAALARDEDMPPLLDACARADIAAEVVSWNDPTCNLEDFDAAVLRSPWDYTDRLPDFLEWCERCAAQTRLINPLDVVRWNTDKHYLADLIEAGVDCVPSMFLEPDDPADQGLTLFLATHAQAAEFVVKPAVGAGSRDARRFGREETIAATAHTVALLEEGRSVLMQPYLNHVDEHGETALIYIDHVFSHAIRKGPLLPRGNATSDPLFASEAISPREATSAERTLGDRVVKAVAARFPAEAPLVYIRVDLLHDAADLPCVLELEVVEPSLFFAHAPAGAERLVTAIAARLGDPPMRSR